MQINLDNLISLSPALEELQDIKMKLSTAYKISKLTDIVKENINFYGKELNKIVNTYGQQDEKGNPILTEDGKGRKIKEEFLDACQKELHDLATLQIEVPDLIFTLEELSSLDLTPAFVTFLKPLIVE